MRGGEAMNIIPAYWPIIDHRVATDVYGDTENPDTIEFYTRADHDNSLIIDNASSVEGGTFCVVLENRNGIPYLMVWTKPDFGNDPTVTMRLDGKKGGVWE